MRQQTPKFLFLALAFALAATSRGAGPPAQNLYVAARGSDATGNGTIASPWATIAYAARRAGPGAVVHVAAGVYTGSVRTFRSGTPSAYLTYQADSADFSHPVACARVMANHGSLSRCARLVGSSGSTWFNAGDYVAIEGFDVTGTGRNGIYTQGNATKIIGNRVHDILPPTCTHLGASGINLNGTNDEVIANEVFDVGPYPGVCAFDPGIYFLKPGGVAWSNLVFDNAGAGIQLWHSPSNIGVANNTIFGNNASGIVLGTDDPSVVVDHITVNNNIVVANRSSGIAEEGYSAAATGTHNTYAHNLVSGNGRGSFSLQNGNRALGTLSANPDFVNDTGDESGDYHLHAGSPAIHAGTSQNAPSSDFDGVPWPDSGGTWDIGAYAYQP